MPNNIRQQALFVTTGDPTTVNDTAPQSPGQLLQRVTVQNTSSGVDPGLGAKTFQYVQVDSSASVAPFKGAVAWWSNRDTGLVTTAATNRGQVAGVFAAATPNLGNFGYIQIGGPATVKFIDAVTVTPDATGLSVIPSATAGKADCVTAATMQPVIGRTNAAYVGALAEGEVVLTLDGITNP